MKRILFLADCGSAHTRKWAIALADRNILVGIFSIGIGTGEMWWEGYKNITVFNDHAHQNNFFSSSAVRKLNYLRLLPALKKIITKYAPDIVHAHYATSYGLLGRLSGFHPFILSAWGSDVMDFPTKGFLYKTLLKGNLKSADVLLATSPTIVQYIHQIVNNEVNIIPFGIDTDVFQPKQCERFDNTVVLGTVKSLEKVYRIDLILKAFASVKSTVSIVDLKLLVVGGGTLEQELKQLANDLQIEKYVHFTGKASTDDVPKYHNMIDIFINVSDYESFGVAVLEASACAKPVIVTNVGGLKDVVVNNETGLIIAKDSIDELTKAMIDLIMNPEKCKEMGIAGRAFVQKNYELSNCVSNMIEIYNDVLRQ